MEILIYVKIRYLRFQMSKIGVDQHGVHVTIGSMSKPHNITATLACYRFLQGFLLIACGCHVMDEHGMCWLVSTGSYANCKGFMPYQSKCWHSLSTMLISYYYDDIKLVWYNTTSMGQELISLLC